MPATGFSLIQRLARLLGIGLLALASASHAQERPATAELTAAQCEGLVQPDFSQVDDAPAKVIGAKLVAAATGPDYCEVLGYTWRNVRFRVRLPATGWNGKLVVFGTAGQAGELLPEDPAALRQGFATATHDGGHISTPIDAQWAYQNESALLDYGFRAPHVAGLIARAVLVRSYGRPARKVYFSGCSNGGREALQMAQRYPYDYNGIIAGAPSMRWSELMVHLHWFTNRVHGSNAPLGPAALGLLHRNALDQCDRIDGKRDGIIDDPRRCRLDLERIACGAGKTTNCLTPAQAKAAREVYDGPRDRDGRQIVYSSAMPGSELTWDDFPGIETYAPSVFRYQSFMPAPGAAFVPDETKLGEYIRRSGGSDAILAATNPDLRRFRDNGGKLLSYMGWADAIGGIRETIDYHAAVERLIGRDAAPNFYRLFMVPGMNHCGGGDGATMIDWLAALDAWVDGGKAPDALSGYHPDADGKPSFVRTVRPLISENEQ